MFPIILSHAKDLLGRSKQAQLYKSSKTEMAICNSYMTAQINIISTFLITTGINDPNTSGLRPA